MKAKRSIILLASLLLTAALVGYAGVLVVYNFEVSSTSTSAPISLVAGTNAGATDLGNNTITVTVTGNYSATIEVHPTYAPTYYFDVLGIADNIAGDGNYSAKICVETPINSANYTVANLYLYNATNGTYVDLDTTDIVISPLDLTVAGCSSTIVLIDGYSYYFVFELQVADGTTVNTTDTFSIGLYYSPNAADLGNTLPP
ncbi:MAG: hypothetical protein GSR72_06605 [Desulfurococcales archaeon]|nr:hypothetical protein [Desulfurococcales archaeon]MEB3789545.1 hypothetical protein [Desulfurococcales archaeon]